MRVDVALASFRKPESLIYTLLTLHRHAAERVGTVWIDDDRSGDGSLAVLSDPELAARLSPWRIELHQHRRRVGSGVTAVTPAMARRLLRPGLAWSHRLRSAWFLATRGPTGAEDIRYGRAIARTGAPFLLILHDDVEIRGDVVSHLLARMQEDPGLVIAGPLGQCWRCGHEGRCAPNRILDGWRPDDRWPLTPPPPGLRWRRRDRACRINEWCCMIRVEAARALAAEAVHFGNAEDGGDTGAYWFAEAVARGWRFADPFRPGGTDRWFAHGWQGHPGHAVWADQGQGRRTYNAAEVRARLAAEFGFTPARR
ncbi:MAG: hypothetical protein ACK4KW_09985 [Gemmobacter sp.]